MAQTWVRSYGGTNNEEARSIVQTSDGGLAFAGYTNSFGAGNVDVWVVKLDSLGAIQWQRTFGGSNQNEFANAIIQTSDGGFAIAGYTASFGAGSNDFWVIKLNSSGGIQWQWTYGGPSDDYAYSIIQTSDGGYAVVGDTNSFGQGSFDIWVLKLSVWGTVQWQRAYGTSAHEQGRAIVQTADGGFGVAGYVYSPYADAWVLKLTGAGDIQWQRTYGGSNHDYAISMVRTADSGFAVAGWTYSYGSGGADFWTIKLNGAGEVEWSSFVGGSGEETAYSIALDTDGGYVVAGTRGPGDVMVSKLDSAGTTQWTRTYGGTSYDAGEAVTKTADGGIAVSGYTISFSVGAADAWVLKLDSMGEVGASCPVLLPGGNITSANSTASPLTQCEE